MNFNMLQKPFSLKGAGAIVATGLVLAWLLPSAALAKISRDQGSCVANMRALGHAIQAYQADNDELLPPVDNSAPLRPYMHGSHASCPVTDDDYFLRFLATDAGSEGLGQMRWSLQIQPAPKSVLAECICHLTTGYSVTAGTRCMQGWPLTGNSGRRGSYVVLRADGSAGLADAQSVHASFPHLEGTRLTWTQPNRSDSLPGTAPHAMPAQPWIVFPSEPWPPATVGKLRLYPNPVIAPHYAPPAPTPTSSRSR